MINRSATLSTTGASSGSEPPPEADGKSVRRRFSAEYKLRILQEADTCSKGGISLLLRREGLYSSLLAAWRRQREAGQLMELRRKKPGPKPDPQSEELRRLRHENERLQVRLRQAEAIIDAQRKLTETSKSDPSSEDDQEQ